MTQTRKFPALDWFRLAAAIFVIAIHTSPLIDFSSAADFWLTRVFARVAVPFFFMLTGYFLARNQFTRLPHVWKRTALAYGAAMSLYLPLNLYAGGMTLPEALQKIFLTGTFYHLWYLPATLFALPFVWMLCRLFAKTRVRGRRRRFNGGLPGLKGALCAASVLYMLGLFGDSYYGFTAYVPVVRSGYDALLSIIGYTRGGLFLATLFILLGAALRQKSYSTHVSIIGFLASLATLSAEAAWLHSLNAPRHDSMYVMLPVCMVFLFSLLLRYNEGRSAFARDTSFIVYLIHPWCIVLVRGAAGVLGLETLFVTNSFVHFCAVTILSVGLAALPFIYRSLVGRMAKPSPTARAWRELDTNALCHNAAVLQDHLTADCALMAVVKANAYGHGAVEVARILQKKCGVSAFAVACVTEGIALRKAGIRGEILVLGYTDPAQSFLLCRWRLTQTVVDEAHALALSTQKKRINVHLALDSGMHRLGIPATDLDAIRRIYALNSLRITGVFSHLCIADSLTPEAKAFTQQQLTAFYAAIDVMQRAGLQPGKIHVQASYGVWNLPAQPCAYARVGIALYGVQSDNAPVAHPLPLRPVLSLRARVATLRTLQPGERAGYACAFTAQRPTKLAVLTIGYADGLPRNLPACGAHVLLHGCRAPLVGRLCMDQMLVDVTDICNVTPGDIATLIGEDSGATIHIQELAEQCETITNELLSRLGSRLPVYQVER